MKKFFGLVLAAVASFCMGVAEKAHAALFGHMANHGLILGYGELPSASDFNSRRVTNPEQSEVFRQRLYDYQLYATAGVAQQTFFAVPVGQGITSTVGAVVGSPKTKSDTNMDVGSTLPSGLAFLIESIEVPFWPGLSAVANTYTPFNVSLFAAANAASVVASANDVNTFYQSGRLELNILQKLYLTETPLCAFPPKTYIGGDFALASTSATPGEVGLATTRASGRAYYIEPSICLQPAVNFNVTLNWPAAVPTGSGFNGRVGVVLDGVFMRASQ
jgi:hypothetical protein